MFLFTSAPKVLFRPNPATGGSPRYLVGSVYTQPPPYTTSCWLPDQLETPENPQNLIIFKFSNRFPDFQFLHFRGLRGRREGPTSVAGKLLACLQGF